MSLVKLWFVLLAAPTIVAVPPCDAKNPLEVPYTAAVTTLFASRKTGTRLVPLFIKAPSRRELAEKPLITMLESVPIVPGVDEPPYEKKTTPDEKAKL